VTSKQPKRAATPAKAPPTAAASALRKVARPRYAVPALEKALDIIELVAARSGGLTGSQIAVELQRSSGEIFRILHCLEQRRIIERLQPGDRFSLTARLLGLALAHPPVDRLLTSAIPIMQDVAVSLRQSCHLAVREGAYILIVAVIPSPASIGFSVRRGARFAMTNAVSGRVLLAFRKPVELQLWLKAIAEDPTVPPPTEKFVAQLERIRARGYEIVASPICPGVTDVAVPVFDDSGGAVAALTVPYFATAETQIAVDAVAPALLAAARKISENLGGGPLNGTPAAAPEPLGRPSRKSASKSR
jgi:DNA-binding IclR family transcriptional regulator